MPVSAEVDLDVKLGACWLEDGWIREARRHREGTAPDRLTPIGRMGDKPLQTRRRAAADDEWRKAG